MSEPKADLLVGKFLHIRDEDGLVVSQGVVRQALGGGRYFVDIFGWNASAAATEVISVDQICEGHWRIYESPAEQHEAIEVGAVQLHPGVLKVLGIETPPQPE